MPNYADLEDLIAYATTSRARGERTAPYTPGSQYIVGINPTTRRVSVWFRTRRTGERAETVDWSTAEQLRDAITALNRALRRQRASAGRKARDQVATSPAKDMAVRNLASAVTALSAARIRALEAREAVDVAHAARRGVEEAIIRRNALGNLAVAAEARRNQAIRAALRAEVRTTEVARVARLNSSVISQIGNGRSSL